MECMEADLGSGLGEFLVDGGLCHNDQLMQIQADTLGEIVYRPGMLETTALGAALAARHAWATWSGAESKDPGIVHRWRGENLDTFTPRISQDERDSLYSAWQHSVDLSLQQKCLAGESGPASPLAASVPGAVFLFTSFLVWMVAAELVTL